MPIKIFPAVAVSLAVFCTSCFLDSKGGSSKTWTCSIAAGDTAPDFLASTGCEADFALMASTPVSASIPGATSMKSVIDRTDGDKLYFQNSKKFEIHWEFASTHLSGGSHLPVPPLATFNTTEYYSPDRRFILGSVTYYAGPKKWTYEISPYDNASAAMIKLAYDKIAASSFFGKELYFHPTSSSVETEAKSLPSSVKVITTDELFAGIDYQPLNSAVSMGRLVFTTAAALDTTYIGFRDIVVLDAVPNDISVVSGIITEQFQTPLSHINVLSHNRGTPNMGLRNARTNATLKALEGKWVRLEVTDVAWNIVEVTQAQADTFWEAHRPPAVAVAAMDTTVKEPKNVKDILDMSLGLGAAIKKAIPAFGGKATNFSVFPHMDTVKVVTDPAFGVPVYFYWKHMQRNGLVDTVTKWLADPAFNGSAPERDKRLKRLRKLIKDAPLDTAFTRMLYAKITQVLPGQDRIRFRSSTNAEDLDGFTGAGLYDSKAGGLNDPEDPIEDAIRDVWASVWYFRAFEERSFRSINHLSVGMALLVHRSHPEEEANGVAITANIFDENGLEPGFYVNVQFGGEPVVSPTAGITTDQFLYYYDMPNQPVLYLAHSSLIASGKTVLTAAQRYALGTALKEIHAVFKPAYGADASKWYAMDTEFKLDQRSGDPGGAAIIIMKQARPYSGLNSGE